MINIILMSDHNIGHNYYNGIYVYIDTWCKKHAQL